MANEPIVAPVVTPAPAPVAVAPVAAPVEAVSGSATPVQAPVTTPAPVAETPPVEAPKAPETVLAEGLDKKPTEAPKEPVTENKEGSKSDEPAPLPVYDAFKVPEGVSFDKERMGEFTKMLSDLEVTGKTDHALVQQLGQKLIDAHVTELGKATEQLNKFYQETWSKQKTDWKDAFLKDPEIGGNRFQTTVDSALTFIRTHGGTPEQQTEFRNLMETSGLGNHPVMIRILANAGRAMSEGKPLAASKPVPTAKSKTETMYGKMA